MNYKENRAEVKTQVQTFKVTAMDKKTFVEKCKKDLNMRPSRVLQEYVKQFNKGEKNS